MRARWVVFRRWRSLVSFAPLAFMALEFQCLDSLGAEASGAWTNLAGHALKATPQSIQGQTVTFAQEGTGKTLEVPLSVFPPSEQERLRSQLQEPTIPEGLQSAFEFSARIIRRARLLRDNGQTSEEDYRKTVVSTLSALRRQAAPLIEQGKLSPERFNLLLRELDSAKE